MNRVLAQRLGTAAGVVLGGIVVAWQLLRPTPCSGAVFVELQPPLPAPGPYRITFALDDGTASRSHAPCSFTVPLPPLGSVDTSQCGVALDLVVRGNHEESTIVGLTIGAAPSVLNLQIERAGELLYDAKVRPAYAEYAVARADDPRFCGRRAQVAPACIAGSSACVPFHATCTRPQDCGETKVCCANPAWGHEYGAGAATRCMSQPRCLDAYGFVACRRGEDCPAGTTCQVEAAGVDFTPRLGSCRGVPL